MTLAKLTFSLGTSGRHLCHVTSHADRPQQSDRDRRRRRRAEATALRGTRKRGRSVKEWFSATREDFVDAETNGASSASARLSRRREPRYVPRRSEQHRQTREQNGDAMNRLHRLDRQPHRSARTGQGRKKEMRARGGLATHVHLRKGDARSLDWIANESVHLGRSRLRRTDTERLQRPSRQLGHVEDYESFLDELDRVCGMPSGFWFLAVGSYVLSATSAWHARTTAVT